MVPSLPVLPPTMSNATSNPTTQIPFTDDQVTAKLAEHESLLLKVEEAYVGPGDIEDNQQLQNRLQKDIDLRRGLLVELEQASRAELKDVTVIKRNTMKRLLTRIGSKKSKQKADQKLQREEREYIDAFQAEQAQRDALIILEKELEAAIATGVNLNQKATTYAKLRADLDTLYQTVFAGPSPHYPEEDAAELVLHTAEQSLQTVQSSLNYESQALSLLEKSNESMKRCVKLLESVVQDGKRSMQQQKGFWSDSMTADGGLFNVVEAGNHVCTFLDQARAAQGQVLDIGRIDVTLRKLFSGDLDDDELMYQNVVSAHDLATSFASKLETEVAASRARRTALEPLIKERTSEMHARQHELETIRKTIFRSAMASKGSKPTEALDHIAAQNDESGPAKSSHLPPPAFPEPEISPLCVIAPTPPVKPLQVLHVDKPSSDLTKAPLFPVPHAPVGPETDAFPSYSFASNDGFVGGFRIAEPPVPTTEKPTSGISKGDNDE